MARRLAAIMFTDIAGYTAMAQVDEAGALRILQEQERLVQPILEAHRGRKVKSIGDGLLFEFPDALDAVECGVKLQRRVHERNAQKHSQPLQIRVGIHLGDVQRRGTDILGDAVNIASRVEPLAEPGGLCLSFPVYDQVHNKVTHQFEKLGPKRLKGVREPVDVYRIVFPWSSPVSAPGGPLLPRVAVLPLANISPHPSDEYFADGLTEELISVLSQVKSLRVISHTSVNQYKGTTKPLAQIGAELGADTILEGSVRKAGDQLRISVQLIDTRTDEHRWSRTYDRKLENVFAIQAEVAEQTASALKVELLKSERDAIQERPTSNLEAYESYLRGIRAQQQYLVEFTAKLDEETTSHFERAIRCDPEFAAAYSYLANQLLAVMGTLRPTREVIPRVRELAATAIRLNPNSSDAHTALGNLAFQADLDWTRAEAEFQQAIALNSSSSTAHFWYGYLLLTLQRFVEAKRQYLSAIELDPLFLLPRTHLAAVLEASGDSEGAMTHLEKLMNDFGESLQVRSMLARLYAFAGRTADALNVLEPLTGSIQPHRRVVRARALAHMGRPEEALAFLADFEKGRVPAYSQISIVAELYAMVGQKEQALDLLEKDWREGDKALYDQYDDYSFDSIRGDPRFVALLRAMKLPTTLSRPLRSGVPHAERTA